MIFIDHLSLRSYLKLLKYLYKNNLLGIDNKIFILDPIKVGIRTRTILFFSDLFKIHIEVADFFCGDYRDSFGESLWSSSKRILNNVAFNSANSLIKKSLGLKKLNSIWGSNTILLHITKKIFSKAWFNEELTVNKILLVEAISKRNNSETNTLLIRKSNLVDHSQLQNITKDIHIEMYEESISHISQVRFGVILLAIRFIQKKIHFKVLNIFHRKSKIDHTKESMTNIMVLQSDLLSCDRSFRTQPHWIFDDEEMDYQTFILGSANFENKTESEIEILSRKNINLVSEYDLYLAKPKKKANTSNLLNSLLICLRLSFFGNREEIESSFHIFRLLLTANLLNVFFQEKNITLGLIFEGFQIEADAMNLLRTMTKNKTISIQYSNMSETTPVMMTTSDLFLSFSDAFHSRWTNEFIKIEKMRSIGYVFDSSFKLLEERAERLRAKLNNIGVENIICYFDESVQDSKYGVISEQEYFSDLDRLSQLILDNPTLALILKPQFSFNSSAVRNYSSKLFNQARQTGRLIELHSGSHRNIIFPAEAALASDVAIGHAIGGTASLEAALVGCRSILINSNEIEGENIESYKIAKILYPSIEEAITACLKFFGNGKEDSNFGTWSKIIQDYDPFIDGMSSMRLKDHINKYRV